MVLFNALNLLGHIKDVGSSYETKIHVWHVVLGLSLLNMLLLAFIKSCAPCIWHKLCGITYAVVSSNPDMHRPMLHPMIYLQLIKASTLYMSANFFCVYIVPIRETKACLI